MSDVRERFERNNAPRESRFDRSSWLTLAIVLVFLIMDTAVTMASYNLPGDGWLIETDHWGRWRTNPKYLANVSGRPSELQAGDILLAVEGVPYEHLEARAASLKPRRPANWKMGQSIHYTVLRNGQEVQVTVTLGRRQPLIFLRPWFLLRNIVILFEAIYLLLGGLVFFLRPRERAAQLLLLFFFAYGFDDLVFSVSVMQAVADLFSVATYWPKIILGNMIWMFFIGPVLTYLFLIFPVKKWPMRRHPHLTLLIVYGGFGVLALLELLNMYSGYISERAFVFNLGPILMMSAVVLSLGHSFLTVHEPIARLQLRWVALGALIGIVGSVFVFMIAEVSGEVSNITISSLWLGLLYLLLTTALPVCLAIAILRYQLWDIDIIIRRTLIYGLLSAALVLVYFGSVTLLQRLFTAVTGQQSAVVIVMSTLLIAALFNPVRRRIQDMIDRRFYRRKYDAAQTLAAFATTARDEVDLDALTSELVRVVQETMQPAYLSLWLRDQDITLKSVEQGDVK